MTDTIAIGLAAETEHALEILTRDGTSREDAIRHAVRQAAEQRERAAFTVRAKRWSHGWELHIVGLGVTQSPTFRQADKMARDYIALEAGRPPDSFDLEITPVIMAVG